MLPKRIQATIQSPEVLFVQNHDGTTPTVFLREVARSITGCHLGNLPDIVAIALLDGKPTGINVENGGLLAVQLTPKDIALSN